MSNTTLRSVDNALKLIELLDRSPKEVSLTSISREMNLAKSTIHRLLTTLANRGYVLQNPETGKYALSLKITHIGFNIMQKFNFAKILRPYLESLSIKLGLSTYSAVYSLGHITYIDEVIASNAPFLDTITGFNFPAQITSAGKLFLSDLTDEQLHEELRDIKLIAHTPFSITSIEQLKTELRKIKTAGYSVDNQESREGIVSISVPIRNNDNQIITAICVSGALSYVSPKIPYIVDTLLETSKEIADKYGPSLF